MASQCLLFAALVLGLRSLHPESTAPRPVRHSAWICLSCGKAAGLASPGREAARWW